MSAMIRESQGTPGGKRWATRREAVVELVCAHPDGISPGDIAKRLGIPGSLASKALQRAAARGLVRAEGATKMRRYFPPARGARESTQAMPTELARLRRELETVDRMLTEAGAPEWMGREGRLGWVLRGCLQSQGGGR